MRVHSTSARRLAVRVAVSVVGCAATGLVIVAPATAAPLWPGGPDVPWLDAPPNAQIGNIFSPPSATSTTISPGAGEVVGGKRAVDIYFGAPVADQEAAAANISVVSSPATSGYVQWVDDRHAQWIPNDHWARGASVTVTAPGSRSTFSISNDVTAYGDVDGHTFTVSIGGDVVRSMPASYGKPGFDTPRGTFSVLEKATNIVMDSSTIGIPVDSAEGYRLTVDYGIRLTWGGIYVHSAPWSVGSQGYSNVSHGCINLSTDNAAWYYNVVQVGDSVTLA